MNDLKILLSKQTSRWLCVVLLVLAHLTPVQANVIDIDSQRVTMSVSNSTLREIIWELQHQTDFSFIYNTKDIEGVEVKNLEVKDKTVTEVLDECLENTNLLYTINNEVLTIKKVEKITEVGTSQQKRTVTGIVVDVIDDSPLINAVVKEKSNPLNAVPTDINGNFSIQVSGNNATLIVTYLGYKEREAPVGELAVLKIVMTADNQMINEVVVIGAGTQQKLTLTGAVSTIQGDQLRMPSTSLTKGLAGQVAGLVAMTGSGEPGSSGEFYIRGISSFGGRNTPLILLDDVEITAAELNSVPADDIEFFTILKDASTTAIYGARGANGVMIVTTKTGKENTRTSISVRAEVSLNNRGKFPEFVDGPTWMTMYNDATISRHPAGAPLTLRFSDEVIENTRNNVNPYIYPNVNWEDLLLKQNALTETVNASISGGGSRVTYYMGLTYTHDAGHVNTPKYYSFDNSINVNKFSFRNNVSYKMTPTTQVSLNMNAIVNQSVFPLSSSTSSTTYGDYDIRDLFKLTYQTNPIAFAPTLPSEEGDTFIHYGNAFKEGTSLKSNPFANLATRFTQANNNSISISLKLNQKLDFITPGLSFYGMANFNNNSKTFFNRWINPHFYKVAQVDPEHPNGFTQELLNSTGGEYIQESSIQRYTTNIIELQARINYVKQIAEHNISAMAIYNQRDLRDDILPYRNQGISGRFQYNYDSRYLFEFNFGYNGTERLESGNRFEFFPAVSAGWVASGESFFEPIKDVVSHLKLRASLGVTGNDQTGRDGTANQAQRFIYIGETRLNVVPVYTGEEGGTKKSGPFLVQYGINKAKWERSRKLDLGLDMVLFNKLNITAEYFYTHTYNILMHRASWPYSLGHYTSKPWENMGEVDTHGYELSADYNQRINQDLNISFRGNITYARNKYVEIDEPGYPYPWNLETGQPLSRIRGYIAEGLFQSQEEIDNSPKQDLGSVVMPGDVKYKDLNGDGVVDSNDLTTISPYGRMPRLQYGFATTINYKNFDFSIFFTGSAKRTLQINNVLPFGAGANEYNMFEFMANNYWTEENPNGTYPRLGLGIGHYTNNYVASTFWNRSGNYLRLKTVELGYKFKYGRVYATGENLAVFAPFKEWDPEISWNQYPLPRVFSLGVQLTF